MTTGIDQKTYLLNKYLKGPSSDKKKKKKRHVKGTGLRIIDDDVDTSKLRPLECDELEALGLDDEDAPQVAGIVDERPQHIRDAEQYNAGKWRVIAQNDGVETKLRVEEVQRDAKTLKEENNVIFGKMYSDSEDEKNNDSDLSPPRRTDKPKANQTKETSESRLMKRKKSHSIDRQRSKQESDSKTKHSSELQTSKREKQNTVDRTQRSKQESDSDLSPPRAKYKQDTNKLITREAKKSDRKKHSSDSDLSPPRKNNEKTKDRIRKPSRWGDFPAEEQPSSRRSPCRSKTQNSDSDLSPPRKNSGNSKERSQFSPSRKSKHEVQERSQFNKNSSKNRPQKDSDSDLSPPRKNNRLEKRDRSIDSDLSPPRTMKDGDIRERKDHRKADFDSRETRIDRYHGRRRNSDSPPPTNKKMAKTLEGKTAGLQDAFGLRREAAELRRREENTYSQMAPQLSGRDAATVSRRTTGKRETSEERLQNKEREKKQKEINEKYSKWSRGLKQISDEEARIQNYMHEASKPLARGRDDVDLERALRAVERDGDPMLEFVKRESKQSGRPVYKGDCPPNRFNIRPGYRWDGVDRSNGYEKKYFDHRSKAKAVEEEAYKWSTEDL